MKRKQLYIILSCVLVLFFFFSCGKSNEEKKREANAESKRNIAQEQAAFKVAVTPTMDCLPLFLMSDSVLYDTAKIDLRLKMFNAHMDIDTALIGGSVQAATTELIRAVELHRVHRARLRPITATTLQWTLVGNKHNKVTTMKSLGDHMIAMSRFSATDWLTREARKKAKTDRNIFDVQINDVALRLNMLVNDEMDAAWLPEPQATVALMKGNTSLMSSETTARHFGLIVFRESEKNDDKREAELVEFKKAYNRAVDLIRKNGINHYKSLIEKYTGVDAKVIAKLPKIDYEHVDAPLRSDVKAAGRIRFQKHTPKVKIR